MGLVEERQVLFPTLTQHTNISSFGSKYVSMCIIAVKTMQKSLKVPVNVYLLKLLKIHVPIIKLVPLS